MSANVFIDTQGYKSLQEVIKKVISIKKETRDYPLDNLAVKAKEVDDLHFTLHALDIGVIDDLSKQEKKDLKSLIEKILKQAAEIEIQKTLKYIQKKRGESAIDLPFDHLEVYNKFFVATFKPRGSKMKPGLFEQLLKNIDITFLSLLKDSKQLHDKKIFSTFPITSVNWTYADIKPHISLGKFQDTFENDINPYKGSIVSSPVKISDFKISRPEVVSNVIWMEK